MKYNKFKAVDGQGLTAQESTENGEMSNSQVSNYIVTTTDSGHSFTFDANCVEAYEECDNGLVKLFFKSGFSILVNEDVDQEVWTGDNICTLIDDNICHRGN